MLWLVVRTVRDAPRRFFLAAIAVAFPVASLAATMLYVDDSVRNMSRVALDPVQIEMRAVATSLDTDVRDLATKLGRVDSVRRADRFAAADVVVSAPGAPTPVSARLFAVDPAYLQGRSWIDAPADLGRGALLNPAVAGSPGFANATTVTIDVPDTADSPLALSIPVGGQIDLRSATSWFAIPNGPVQGDIAVLPRALVVDYALFEQRILPALRTALGPATSVTNPGLSEPPPASIEVHIGVDHGAYPSDPGDAAKWSLRLRRVLERQVPGSIIVADNAVEPLQEASSDATNAKILFLLLGIPGTIVAAALGLAAASALSEAHRREDALLKLRGATDAQLVRGTVIHGVLASVGGTALGLIVAGLGVAAVIGHPVWRYTPGGRLALTAFVAIVAGMITTAARLLPLLRSSRRSAIAVERRQLGGQWRPAWRRARLDVVAVVVGLTLLGANWLSGGLKPAPTQSQELALSFYVLLAPIALWIGTTLVIVRIALWVLARRSRPDRPRPLGSWRATAVRWLGRRPARTSVALALGALAVAFGVEVASFVATYDSASRTETRAAFGADLQVTPESGNVPPPPDLGPDTASITPLRSVAARVGSDRKTVMVIDVDSYRKTVAIAPQITRGGGLDALASNSTGVLVAEEIANDFDVGPGDTLPATILPDDPELSQKLDLRVVGVFRAFPPTDPISELVMTTAPLLPPPVPPPDVYLARLQPGRDSTAVASRLQDGDVGRHFTVAAIGSRIRQEQRSLTALNLDGLSRIEAIGAALVATVGVGVLGAFLVLERRREFAILRTVGASTRHVLTGPVLEGSIAAIGSLVVGIPIGLGLGALAVRVLGLFFTLPAPLLTVPVTEIVVLSAFVIVGSAFAIGIAMRTLGRAYAAEVLREP